MYSNILQLIWNSQSNNNVTNHVDAVVHLGFLLPGTDKIPTRRPVSISTWCCTSPPPILLLELSTTVQDQDTSCQFTPVHPSIWDAFETVVQLLKTIPNCSLNTFIMKRSYWTINIHTTCPGALSCGIRAWDKLGFSCRPPPGSVSSFL